MFDIRRSVHHKYIYIEQPRRCNFSQFYLVHKMLHMFQAVPPPIIRSSKLYTQHQVFARLMLLPAAIMEEMERSSISSTIAADSSISLANT